MYKSPIEVITSQINMQIENEVYKAVGNVGINVDREELLKALAYDRGQYEQGYRDALNEQSKIVRCKDCIHWDDDDCEIGNNPQMFAEDWYCPCGEVKQDGNS